MGDAGQLKLEDFQNIAAPVPRKNEPQQPADSKKDIEV